MTRIRWVSIYGLCPLVFASKTTTAATLGRLARSGTNTLAGDACFRAEFPLRIDIFRFVSSMAGASALCGTW
jgi:hypothetical protein